MTQILIAEKRSGEKFFYHFDEKDPKILDKISLCLKSQFDKGIISETEACWLWATLQHAIITGTFSGNFFIGE